MSTRRTTLVLVLALAMISAFALGCADEESVESTDYATHEQALGGPKLIDCMLNNACPQAGWAKIQQLPGTSPLLDVWGNSPNEFHVIGYTMTSRFTTNNNGRALRYDGVQWEDQVQGQALHGIHSAKGKYEPVVVGVDGFAKQWDGTGWTGVTTSTNATLNDAYLFQGKDGYLIGDGGTVLRLVGNSARTLVAPTNVDLNGVWGTNGVAIVVGDDGALLSARPGGLTTIPTPVTVDLNAVWGTNGVAIVAGDDGTVLSMGIAGTNTAIEPVPTSEDLNGVWGTNGVAIVVGDNGTVLVRDGRHGAWEAVAPFTTENLTSVWGSSLSNIIVTGEDGSVYQFALTK